MVVNIPEGYLFPGYVSWRDTNTGSWYVETLDRILETNAATDDLATMLIMVQFVFLNSPYRQYALFFVIMHSLTYK